MKINNRAFLTATTVAFGLALAVSATAQVTMYPNGHVAIGNVSQSSSDNIPSGSPEIIGSSVLQVDTTSTISLHGKGVDRTGGKLSFGGTGNVWIGESANLISDVYPFGKKAVYHLSN